MLYRYECLTLLTDRSLAVAHRIAYIARHAQVTLRNGQGQPAVDEDDPGWVTAGGDHESPFAFVGHLGPTIQVGGVSNSLPTLRHRCRTFG